MQSKARHECIKFMYMYVCLCVFPYVHVCVYPDVHVYAIISVHTLVVKCKSIILNTTKCRTKKSILQQNAQYKFCENILKKNKTKTTVILTVDTKSLSNYIKK